MVKCDIKDCKRKADLIREEQYYCATCYMELFMKAISKTRKLKRRIEGRLCQNKLAIKKL